MERSVVPASLILSNSLCSHVFCDILITEIVLEGQSKAVFAFVCTSVYMFIRDVCVIGGLGGGVGLDREIQPRQLLILCLRVPLLWYFWENALYVFFFKYSIFLFCSLLLCDNLLYYYLKEQLSCMKDMLNVWIVYFSQKFNCWYCRLSNVQMICLCRFLRIAFIN